MNEKTDTTKWSGEGTFTQTVIDHLAQMDTIALVCVENAPTSRSEADYNFISNEIYVVFATTSSQERVRRFGILPLTRTVTAKVMTIAGLEVALTAEAGIGAPDYADDGLLQYLRTERIIPPYQTRGYKLVELVRIYEANADPDSNRH
jgi:hypothetical protein